MWFFKFRKPDKAAKKKPGPDDYADDDGEDENNESDQEDGPEASDKETERDDE